MYKVLDYAMDIVNLRFGDFLETVEGDINPYNVLLVDYISDYGVRADIIASYEQKMPEEIKEVYDVVKEYIKENWDNSWGQLTDEDLVWLFHYEERDGEYWINSEFEKRLDEIVFSERASEELWNFKFSMTDTTINTIFDIIEGAENSIEVFVEFLRYVGRINAYLSADEEFKQVLEYMCDNSPIDSETSLHQQALLVSVIEKYTKYNDANNVYVMMIADFTKETTEDSALKYFTDKATEQIEDYVKATPHKQ